MPRCVSEIIPCSWHLEMNKTDKISALRELIYWGRKVCKQDHLRK